MSTFNFFILNLPYFLMKILNFIFKNFVSSFFAAVKLFGRSGDTCWWRNIVIWIMVGAIDDHWLVVCCSKCFVISFMFCGRILSVISCRGWRIVDHVRLKRYWECTSLFLMGLLIPHASISVNFIRIATRRFIVFHSLTCTILYKLLPPYLYRTDTALATKGCIHHRLTTSSHSFRIFITPTLKAVCRLHYPL